MKAAERDTILLGQLTEEWADAGDIARWATHAHDLDKNELSAVGAGRVLSRLAREGRCERWDLGYYWRYRALAKP